MSFQAYLTNIHAKTGKTAADFRALAQEKGITEGGTIRPGVKAATIAEWLRDDFGLGHGHSMAIYSVLKGTRSEDTP